MRRVIYLLTALFVAVGLAFLLKDFFSAKDPGYVVIGFGHWSMETSLLFLVFILIIVFFIFYSIFRLLGYVMRVPKRLKQRSGDIKSSKSQKALVAGLIDSAEGNWEQSEKVLIRHAANSGTPLINYLTAAKAAQSRGAYEKRDEYLERAYESTPGSEIAIGLTQAEMQLSEQQVDKALESLTHLKSIAPTHASVLKLLHKAYVRIQDWEAIRTLIPALQKNKVLMEAELKLLEIEAYSALLKKESESGNADTIQELWQTVPEHINAMSGVQTLYFAAMIEVKAGDQIEKELRKVLDDNWNESLVVLYGCIELANPKKQLRTAEKWLSKHPNDAILLRMLGKLAMRHKMSEKSEKYFSESLNLEPSVDAYLFLGDLLSDQNDKGRASECYRKGLMLASDEIVKQVEVMPVDLEHMEEPAVNQAS